MENQLPVIPLKSDADVPPARLEATIEPDTESSGTTPDWVFYSDFSDQGDAVAQQQQL